MAQADPSQGSQVVITPWAERPLEELVDHILARYHGPLRSALRRTQELLERLQAHRVSSPNADWHRLDAVASCFAVFSEELLLDMNKEEGVLFPWIRAGRGSTALMPIAVMQRDHSRIAALTTDLCRLSSGLALPADLAGESLELQMAEIQVAMGEHLQLEELLFMRALAS